MDIVLLRAALGPALITFACSLNHRPLTETCADLGLTAPSRNEGSPASRMEAAWQQVEDSDVVPIARRFLARHCDDAAARNRLEDLLDASLPALPLHRRLRHELARALNEEPLYGEAGAFRSLLKSIWALNTHRDEVGRLSRVTIESLIDRHLFTFPDWGAEDLFEYLGVFESTNRRFARFLEGMAAGEVWRSIAGQARFVATVNEVLTPAGLELRQTDERDGYPVYTLVSQLARHPSRPKNLIFATLGKPDLRISDLVSNDIDVLNGCDDVLVYDRPLGEQGLVWKDLEAWWKALHPTSDRKALYQRLLQSVPSNSPPQRNLLISYYQLGRRYDDLPALLPEVWLHWDPKTIAERGVEAMARFRMDFLLLLPGNRRVVVEVDGQHHYAHKDGRADPHAYAKMVRADRDLQLAGYEVYRFGAVELSEADSPQLVHGFFEHLLRRSGITPNQPTAIGRRSS